jgi:hypothetical protein
MAIPALLTYTTPSNAITAAAQTELLAMIDVLLNKIPDPDTQSPSGDSPDSPLWNDFSPRMAAQMRAELTAIKTAIDATAVS